MKIKLTITGILVVLIYLLNTSVFAAGQGYGRQGNNSPAVCIEQYPMETVDKVEIEGLLHMYEEEKLARDVYSTLFEIWGQRTFGNIARSEQKHMDAVKALLLRYDIELPANAATPNSFDSKKMQDLYDTLIKQGSQSRVDALLVGATIEDLDIYDLREYIDSTDNDDIRAVYRNLQRGSRNHMRSFAYQLTLNNASYEPQYLTQEEINTILSTEMERGRSIRKK